MDARPLGPVFKNMQHAIVEALHELGPSSGFPDQSVRMRDLFAKVESAPIEVNGQIDNGPHRFSIFNSAISGRRSAAELFERVEDSNRQGAWWRLRTSYEEALQYALTQKGFKSPQQRVRQHSEPISQPERPPAIKQPQPICHHKSESLAVLEKVKRLATKVSSLSEENAKLAEHSAQLSMDLSLLQQIAPPSLIEKLEAYRSARKQEESLRNQIIRVQKQLQPLMDQSLTIQNPN